MKHDRRRPISHEAGSCAGSMELEKLNVFYDDNSISIDGHVDGWFNDDTPKRFEAYRWRVIPNVNGLDSESVEAAVAKALTPCGRPRLVCCKTVIGFGAPKAAGTHESHGAALGASEVAATRAALGWPYPAFEVPDDIRGLGCAAGRGSAAGGVGEGVQSLRRRAPRRRSRIPPPCLRRSTGGFCHEGGCGDRGAASVTDPIAHPENLAERDHRVGRNWLVTAIKRLPHAAPAGPPDPANSAFRRCCEPGQQSLASFACCRTLASKRSR
jgi:transketolase